ncbi:hypothetical protein [Tunicatimonas pelagia]|uniref:hypothetical protein n=1 Tax=Tunicatimonas pelagia TaxID=931531 RepID=UPI0026658F23|nr:hypothetical protein [Tunicatimonas pelagia]WKN42141.1 hypothetical protein P0M28_24195 [Tunicatimonas pelagia]
MQYSKGKLVHIPFILLALFIILDFILPGNTHVSKVLDVKKELQQYYNAAGNYHYSYRILTAEHSFSISEEFARVVQKEQEIRYEVSWLFEEINNYGLVASTARNIYLLRVLSGLILPLLAIVVSVLAYKYERKVSVVIFVFQLLLLGDLLFLII